MAVKNENKYLIEFSKLNTKSVYSVQDTDPITQNFISFYDNFVLLLYKHLADSSVIVSSPDQQITYLAGRDYQLDAIGGAIKVFDPQTHPGATMADKTEYTVRYNYYPLWQSVKVDSQLTNTPFNGLRLVVKQSKFGVNDDLTDWSVSSTTSLVAALLNPRKSDLTDYEFKFSSAIKDTAVNNVLAPFTITDSLP